MTLHFIRPTWLWALLPALIYLLWVIYSYRQHNPWKKICDPHLLPSLIQTNPNASQRPFYLALFLFFSICIVALAGPAWKKASLPTYREVGSLMLVLDLSSAMEETDLKPDRLTRAKYKIRDLINDSQNTQMGLVVFTKEAFTVSPLSEDAYTLNSLLDELNPGMMPVAGSDSGEGLVAGYKLLKQAAAEHDALLLITASNPTAASLQAANTIAAGGGHLSVYAMLENSPKNKTILANLQQLAKLGHGKFYQFTADTADIQTMADTITSRQIIKDDKIQNAYLWLDAGPWFCLLLIPIALLVLRENMRHEKI